MFNSEGSQAQGGWVTFQRPDAGDTHGSQPPLAKPAGLGGCLCLPVASSPSDSVREIPAQPSRLCKPLGKISPLSSRRVCFS